MFGILALLGPPAFALGVGGLSVVYSLLLVVYALWGLRLTVVFYDDDSLGYILCAFDVVLTAPLVLWGSGTSWVVASLALVWVGGLGLSVLGQRQAREAARAGASGGGAALGLPGPERFVSSLEQEIQVAAATGRPAALVALRVYRYEEFVACHGAAAAERAVAALARRALRIAGEGAEVFRLRRDTLVLVVPGCAALQANEAAAALSQAANSRLIEGRRVDSFVGYALFPRDGVSAEDLLRSALSSGAGRSAAASSAPRARAAASPARTQPAAGSLAV